MIFASAGELVSIPCNNSRYCCATSCPACRVRKRSSAVSAQQYAAPLQITSISEIAFRPIFAAAIISSCLLLFPAETAFAVACVIAFVHRSSSSAVTLLL